MANEAPVAPVDSPPATAAPPAIPTVAEVAVKPPHTKEVFPPFDPTFFASQILWFAITFVALYLILARFAIPRIAAILATRRGRITGDLGIAEKARESADAAGKAYDKALSEARAGAFTIAEKAREAAKSAANAERGRIEADLAGRLASAEARIAEIKEKALAEVGAIAAEATGAVVGVLSDAKVSQKEIADAVGSAMSGRNAGGN